MTLSNADQESAIDEETRSPMMVQTDRVKERFETFKTEKETKEAQGDYFQGQITKSKVGVK